MDEFVEIVKKVINNPRIYQINMNQYSWKNKAEEFERVLTDVIEHH